MRIDLTRTEWMLICLVLALWAAASLAWWGR